MRILIWVIVSLGILWSGYWFVGSNAVERGLTTWLANTPDRQWTSAYSSLNTRGFPNRFDTTFRDIEIDQPALGMTWAAPFFQIFALSYKPNHLIAAWPNRQTITLPSDVWRITSDRMRGSVVFSPEPSLPLNRSDIEISSFGLQSNQGWSVAAKAAQLNTRKTKAKEYTHNVFVKTAEFRPADRFMRSLDPKQELPKFFELIQLDAELEFNKPWDRHAIEQQLPTLIKADINQLQIVWGALDFSATGILSTDARGYLQGDLKVTARNWQDIYEILRRLGWVQDDFFGAIQSLLTLMALETEDANVLVAEWSFQDGRMRFGAIPLGPAPRLVRR